MYLGWIFSFMVCSCPLNSRDDGNLPSSAARRAVLDLARDEREQGVVLADPDVRAREHLGAALADEHGARLDLRARVFLHAQTLSGGIAAVAGGTRALLVCHLLSEPLDLQDAQGRFVLAVTLALP